MSSYLNEVERLHNITNGIDGVYSDPDDKNMVVIRANGMTVRVSKESFNKLIKKVKK
ncbi:MULTISPECIES: hypothetical protein [Enterobacteriaceae]|uniref:hypothetical protein n=1 Tax=Enterobacteriaceae TaxID=543 RepID=UPI002E2C9CBD|nr:hypothetical protein [Klebsiella pneumoniae]MED6004927.1 hypothetical protein [Klebsiella pneumoniae]MED6058259.1 hypothetical protein [Klebsiella pneumoniae]